MSNYLSSRLAADPAITVSYGAEISALHGGETLEAVTIRDVGDGAERTIDACAVFIMVGAAPNTHWLCSLVALDDKGFILTGEAAGGDFSYGTSHSGRLCSGRCAVRLGQARRRLRR
jgi:thioredoxin reductase (NADPH)